MKGHRSMENLRTQRIREHIFELADEKYQKFQRSLVPGNEAIVGVRIPVLRSFAKELLQEYSVEELLTAIGDEYYEEIMLQGMVIGLQKKPQFSMVEGQVREFVPKIDNWAVCDIFCSELKITKSHKKEMLGLITEYIQSKEQYQRRFAVVMLLDYYVEPEYLPRIFEWIDSMDREGYYVQMAVAWAVSVCFVKQYDKTLEYMKKCKLEEFIFRKSIQKTLESYRVSDKQKDELRQFRVRHLNVIRGTEHC